MSDSAKVSVRLIYRRLFRYARPYRLRLTVAIVAGLMVGGSIFSLLHLSPRILQPFERGSTAEPSETPAQTSVPQVSDAIAEVPMQREIEKFESFAKRLNITLTHDDGTLTGGGMALMLSGLPLVALIWMMANYLNRYFMRWVGARVVRDLRDDLFGHLQKQ